MPEVVLPELLLHMEHVDRVEVEGGLQQLDVEVGAAVSLHRSERIASHAGDKLLTTLCAQIPKLKRQYVLTVVSKRRVMGFQL